MNRHVCRPFHKTSLFIERNSKAIYPHPFNPDPTRIHHLFSKIPVFQRFTSMVILSTLIAVLSFGCTDPTDGGSESD